MLFPNDKRILELFDDETGGGWTTRQITVKLHGNVNLRRESAIMYRRLYQFAAAGYLKEADQEKPIVWIPGPRWQEVRKYLSR